MREMCCGEGGIEGKGVDARERCLSENRKGERREEIR